jgi:hypothetical protein
MGILGPQRAIVTDAGWSENGPYKRVNNDYSIIDEVDLVMIDPVGTGFSKPVGEAKGEDFGALIRTSSRYLNSSCNISPKTNAGRHQSTFWAKAMVAYGLVVLPITC